MYIYIYIYIYIYMYIYRDTYIHNGPFSSALDSYFKTNGFG